MAEITVATLCGFASGVSLAAITALIKFALDRHKDRRQRIEANTFDVFMLLMELEGMYFFVASAELRHEEVAPETKRKVMELAWRIADKLRYEDEVPYLHEILSILMCEPAYDTAFSRHTAMVELVKRLGAVANPRYAQVIEAVSAANVAQSNRTRLQERKAPGLLWSGVGR